MELVGLLFSRRDFKLLELEILVAQNVELVEIAVHATQFGDGVKRNGGTN